MINFERELNTEQLEAVTRGEGPCLVLSGAGSGKTRVITYRVAFLLERGVHPSEILLLTFTNKAAKEMNKRVALLTGGKLLPWSGTFHHVAYRLLRIYAPLVGFGPNFTVLDADDAQALIKLAVKEVAREGRKFPSAGVLAGLFSFCRNAERPFDEVLEKKYPGWWNIASDIKTVFDRYTLRKKEGNLMDFDDLLVNTAVLLNQPEVRAKYAAQFRYILVDEYQDTNKLQASIIRQLSSVHRNILVVGDDAQSIYSFRAAIIENILRFEEEYPDAKLFKLETNYRSTAEILDFANNSIANNARQYAKELRAFGKNGVRPTVHPQLDQAAEADFVVRKISEALEQGVPPHEIAVLFRAAYHSQRLEVALTKAGMEYEYRGGVRFFERAHVKDVLCYLRILYNSRDTAAWMRVLLHEEGIGPAAAERITRAVKEAGRPEDIPAIGDQIVAPRGRPGWHTFSTIWTALLGAGQDPGTMIAVILMSPYREWLEREFIDSRERLEDLKQLGEFAAGYKTLPEFLSDTSLQEAFALQAENTVPAQPTERIVLSTIHQAKGLEWSRIFIINAAAGAFPNERSLKESGGLEEERRLFYVAITRAKDALVITYPLTGGNFGDFLSGPSVFIEEVNPALYEDFSLLSSPSTVFNDPDSDITYVPEDDVPPPRLKPGSFLREIEDL